MSVSYELSEDVSYPDVTADSSNLNATPGTGLIWRDALNNDTLKVLSASDFKGRVLGITSQGEIAWVNMSNPVTAFGEVSVAQVQPVIQQSFLSGVIQQDSLQTLTQGSGAVTFADYERAHINITATAGDRAIMFTKTELDYRPGQGSIVRFTTVFDTGQTNSRQYAGFGNYTGGFYFGYQNTSFGIFHLQGGNRHIHKFVVTTAATSSQTATVTLNGTAFNVPLTDSGEATEDLAYTAYELCEFDYSSAGFEAECYDNVIYFIANFPEVRSGTYSFSSTGDAAATVSQIRGGAAFTENFVPQASWNGDDVHDGNGASGHTINPQNGNVYQVQFQWLGYGCVYFSIENPVTASLEQVHVIKYPSSSHQTTLENPSGFIAFWVEANGGTPGGAIDLHTASIFAGTEGASLLDYGPIKYSKASNLTGVTANTERPVISIRANRLYNERATTNVIRLLFISVASDSNKPIEVDLRRGNVLGNGTIDQSPTLIQDFPWWVYNDSTNSCACIDTQSETTSGGSIILSFTVGKTDSKTLDVSNLGITIRPGESITLSVRTTNSSNDITASLSWVESHS